MKQISTVLIACLAVAGCATQTKMPREVVGRSSGAVGDTVSQTANGVGGAVEAPLRDFNLMHEAIPAALIKAQTTPYDMTGLETCDALLVAVGELDIALGPDIDTPSEGKHQDNYGRGASFAAQAALDAVKDTAEGVIPMKTWVRKLSGAEQADNRARKAILAGMARRAFLKGLGVMHNCTWPAAPLSFEPRKETIATAQPAPPPPEPPPPVRRVRHKRPKP